MKVVKIVYMLSLVAGLTNLLEEWNEFGYLTGGDVQDLKMTEEEEEEEGGGGEGEEEEEEVEQQQQQQEMKLVTRKRRGVDLALANRGSHGAAYVMSKSKSMARFMKGNLKRLSNTLSALQNKLTAASAMLERIEKKHIQSFQQQLDRLQRAFDPNLGEQEPLDKAGFWTIDILDMPQVVRFYCKKKVKSELFFYVSTSYSVWPIRLAVCPSVCLSDI